MEEGERGERRGAIDIPEFQHRSRIRLVQTGQTRA